MTRYSILDLVPITLGSDAGTALARSQQLAINAESWGYHRYWVAEHHNMPGIASSATAVVIGHIASATQHLRVGSGGIMLPNHAPLMVAEQFGTLATHGDVVGLHCCCFAEFAAVLAACLCMLWYFAQVCCFFYRNS